MAGGTMIDGVADGRKDREDRALEVKVASLKLVR